MARHADREATGGRAAVARRYLASRKNIAGMAGAVAGIGLHIAGLVGDVWPVVAAGLYGAGALVAPADPLPEPAFTEELRAEATALLGRVQRHAGELPPGSPAALSRIVQVVRLVLHRLDEVSDQPAQRAAAPERLAVAAGIVRADLPACLGTYLGRSPSSSASVAAAELTAQLDVIAGAVDRLAAEVPDVHAQRAEDLTRDLRRRHEQG